VLTLESRRSPELALLVLNYGGSPIVAPSLREIALAADPAPDAGPNRDAIAMAQDVVRGRFDLVTLMTGVGVRMWMTLVAPVLGRDVFVEALGRARILARGPKPVAALRELGVTPWATVPSPNTWRELVATLDARAAAMPLSGARVAVQEYGLPNPDLAAALEARGASVTAVPIYRWAMPEDAGPLRRAVHALIRNEIDLVILTAGVQLVHLLRAAAEMGLEPAVRRGLQRTVIASIGPMTSEELQRQGLRVDYESSHPKMGFLVKELAERCDDLLRAAG
jgi:uroporphyrinogen-III synthase